MGRPVGCKTEICSTLVRTALASFHRVVVEQEWFLHPTKGWRRGPKSKRIEPVRSRSRFRPLVIFETKWKSWR